MNLKSILLITAISFTLMPATAYVVTEETTSPEAIINGGYSTVTADYVQLEKAKSQNREYKTARTLKKPFWRKAWEYINFGADDGTLLQHDIKPGQSYTDW